ncbi:glutamate dehydrogenase [Lutibacter sp. B1]|uniref:THC0290_0291 family protein n=1 Tax=Lutibacter sp. B1 TaxID=2725996 RepID=UPI0014579514|nr:glutamate dehydrogenase [Lutibacter sp. B1]NLP57641.1 glutamate dehydrogenase [Lutibacter sp. B1]
MVNLKAQHSGKSHEIGIIAGSASFTTDYGQRNNFMSNVGGNVGMGIGLVYYMNFTNYRYKWNQRTRYFNEHFRIRAELSYMSAKLDHFGKYVDKSETSYGADQLRAHHGETKLINVGAQLEFHWVDIVDFGSRRIPDLKWSPYLSAGVFVDFYDPTISSDLGDWRDPDILYPKWDPNIDPKAARDDSGITLSATLGIGTRYKLGEYSDILIESRWQYFFSNYVDGLNSRPDPANKYNDWLLWVHVGYVYYLN